jgi:hypothetical protein
MERAAKEDLPARKQEAEKNAKRPISEKRRGDGQPHVGYPKRDQRGS